MSQLTAKDLMSTDVVTVPPETPVSAIAQTLASRGISAVPVANAEGTLLGIVTEADLIRRLAGSDGHSMGFLRQLFSNMDRLAERYAATHGRTAQEVMSSPPITVAPDATASAIAELMSTHNIRRVMVVEGKHLRGMVSRADLLRALLTPPVEEKDHSDTQLRRDVLAAIKREPWASTFYTLVEVKDGVVELHGFSHSEAVQRGLKVLIEGVPGVKKVVDKTQPLPPGLFATA